MNCYQKKQNVVLVDLVAQKNKKQIEFENKVTEKFGDEYKFLHEYSGVHTKIECVHKKCGFVWMVTPSIFFGTNIPCPNCRKSEKAEKSNIEWIKKVKELVGDEYTFLEKYINIKEKIKVIHNKCNHIYKVDPEHFARGNRCPNCFGNPIITEDSWNEYVKEETNGEYEFIEPYKKSSISIRCVHKLCGHIYKVTPNSFKSDGTRCPRCAGKMNKTTEEFSERVWDLVGDEYSVIGEYRTARKKVKMIHNLCKKEWEVVPYAFYKGNRCPHCTSSKGEKAVRSWLESNSIDFTEQYFFDNLVCIKPLLFDFAIVDSEGNLSCLIEYDGEQHFRQIEYFGGDKKFKKQMLNDSLKNEYCNDNNINLLRIPYLDFNKIDVILSEYFQNKLGEY